MWRSHFAGTVCIRLSPSCTVFGCRRSGRNLRKVFFDLSDCLSRCTECGVTLMYPPGSPSVGCAICGHVSQFGDHPPSLRCPSNVPAFHPWLFNTNMTRNNLCACRDSGVERRGGCWVHGVPVMWTLPYASQSAMCLVARQNLMSFRVLIQITVFALRQ